MQTENLSGVEVRQKIKALFPKEFRVDEQSLFYQNLIKKGHYIKPTLGIDMIGIHADPLNKKVACKLQLLRIFKKTKLIRHLDFSRILLESREFFLSTFLYIAKRASKISVLSVFDARNVVSQFQGLVTSWPKYMKHLRSLRHESLVTLFNWARRNQNRIQPPETILLMTDFLRYTRKLDNIQVVFPNKVDFSSCLNNLWRFEKYPKSIKKLVLCEAQYSQNMPNISLASLTDLKDLEITLKENGVSLGLMKSVCDLILQVNQLEVLNIRFVEKFEIDTSICEGFKTLSRLRKVKFEFSLREYGENIRILESLEECLELRSLNLKILLQNDKDITGITRLLEKKKEVLEALKIQLLSPGVFRSSDEMKELVKAINNLPQLTSLYLSAKSSKPSKEKDYILEGAAYCFSNLFSKTVKLKKFRISLEQPWIWKEEFFAFAWLMKEITGTLEKLEINIGDFHPDNENDMNAVLEFISSLKNIRSLKLTSLEIQQKDFMWRVIEAIYQLKFLRSLSLGDFSGEITKQLWKEGVEKILCKYGLWKFKCKTSLIYMHYIDLVSVGFPPDPYVDVAAMKKINPYLKTYDCERISK